MHDALYENQRAMSDDLFSELARKLGLEESALNQSLQQGTYEKRVREDLESGEASGVHGTPTFYINGKLHAGAFDYDSLVEAIEAEAK